MQMPSVSAEQPTNTTQCTWKNVPINVHPGHTINAGPLGDIDPEKSRMEAFAYVTHENIPGFDENVSWLSYYNFMTSCAAVWLATMTMPQTMRW